VDCSGKTVIVTGANVGLGKSAAAHFVSLNADKIIIACRSVEKGEAAKAEIIKSVDNAKTTIEVWPLDLSNYDSIRSFVKRANALERLDIVVENAGQLGLCLVMLTKSNAALQVSWQENSSS
jgi:NAD(P)-dependent dehydrogenase (short-subunit alcohol dehydrogenase family)